MTDLARYANPSEPKVPISTWMRNKDVISYLGLWEKLHNPDFKGHEFEPFENAAGKHSFYLSPHKCYSDFFVFDIILYILYNFIVRLTLDERLSTNF